MKRDYTTQLALALLTTLLPLNVVRYCIAPYATLPSNVFIGNIIKKQDFIASNTTRTVIFRDYWTWRIVHINYNRRKDVIKLIILGPRGRHHRVKVSKTLVSSHLHQRFSTKFKGKRLSHII